MKDAILQKLYLTQMFAKGELVYIAAALDPAAKDPSIAGLSALPADFIASEYHAQGTDWVNMLRSDPGLLNTWYDLENSRLAGHALDMRKAMIRAESDLYGLTTAVIEYYKTRNEPYPAELLAQSQDALKASEKRLSHFIQDLDELLDDAAEDSHELNDQVQGLRAAKSAEYLERLHKGFDYKTMYDHSLNMIATEYLNVANAYVTSAGLHAAVQILRLETKPASFGSDEHQTLHHAMKNDLKHVATAIGLAKAASPANAPESAETMSAPSISRPN